MTTAAGFVFIAIVLWLVGGVVTLMDGPTSVIVALFFFGLSSYAAKDLPLS